MSPAWEQGLRRCMEALGRVVEWAIGGVKHAKVQVETRGGLQPILSLEDQLPVGRIRELIAAAEDRIFPACFPKLNQRRALEIAEGPVRWVTLLMKQGAEVTVGLEIGGPASRQGDLARGFILRGQATALPLTTASFDYVAARLATQVQGDFPQALREMARVMTSGGQGVIVDYHPFGLYAQHGDHRLRSRLSSIRGLEDYYKLCRSVGLYVVDLRELFIDESLRPRFAAAEIAAYRSLKGTPLVLCLFVYKRRGKGT